MVVLVGSLGRVWLDPIRLCMCLGLCVALVDRLGCVCRTLVGVGLDITTKATCLVLVVAPRVLDVYLVVGFKDSGDAKSRADEVDTSANNQAENDEKSPDADNALPLSDSAKNSNEESEEKITTDDQTEKHEETETEEKPEEIENGGEPEEPAPPPYTLETACEDIDHFLPNFSSILQVQEEEKKEVEAKVKEEEVEEEEKKETEVEEEKAEADAEVNEKEEVEEETETEAKKEEENKETEEEVEKEMEAEVEDEGLEIPDFVEKYLDLVEEKLSSLESSASSHTRLKGYQLPDDDPSFFKAAGQMTKLYKDVSAHIKPESKQGPLINRISAIQHRIMCYLEEEFRYIFEESRNEETDQIQEAVQEVADDVTKKDADQSTEPGEDEPLATEESKFEEYSDNVLANITKIADELIAGGHELECCEIYMITRRHVLGETLKNIGYEKIGIDEAQKTPWESLERDIPQWIQTFKQCANVHLPAERKLVQTIFYGYSTLSDSIITNLSRCLFLQFLNFPEAVAFCKLSPEKLFKFLDMYEALRDNLSPIDSVENAPVPGGAVHPLTRYIMNYLKYACEYKDTIEQVFKDHSKIERADSTSRPRNYVSRSEKYKKNDAGEDRPPFQEQLMRIIDLLEQSIDSKSMLYKDVPLSCIFMMNNGSYMLQKIKGTPELYEVVGDNWCRSRSFDVRNYHKVYQRETWLKLLGCISSQGLTVKGKVVKPVLKEKFKNFNAMFDEIYRTQSTWVVSDKQLQSELRVSIASVVIPAYRSFLGRYSGYLDPGRQTEKYIKYQPDDIETYIDELFDGRKN
ncbi:Malate dehydrogenase family protein [Hibiscus syriacus]|uniref:Exocyst subunit Exo70 family protein n=1 Tax=Hibiscus syriacus TaxID=106335 RepID=A0A6A2WRN0_HIBSY|nr:Malate dehydrogenase family protein [Hibiscus syriacus]